MRNQLQSVQDAERAGRRRQNVYSSTTLTHCVRRSALAVTLCLGLAALSGCYSMNGYVMNASGHGYYDQGNYAMAAREFQTALASSPENPDYMANLARAKMKMGDSQAAEQLYRQALTVAPSHQPSYHGLSDLMLTQGRGHESLKLLNTWAATQPYTAEPHVELAWMQREMGQPDAAARSLQAALEVNPNHSTALAHLGQYYQDSGQEPQAVSLYQRSLRADWNQPEVHSRLASAAGAAGVAHPMSRTAMARGVHPQSLPRQQLAFGPPNQAAQFIGGPVVPQPQMAFQPPMMGQQPPQTGAFGPQPVPSESPIAMAGFNPLISVPLGTGAPNPSFTAPLPPSISTGMEHPSAVEMPAPVPDPAFASEPETLKLNIPTTSVSQSSVIGDEAVPEVEAF
ncbi:MAG: tetratricopeptide repeat protein [Fuerstiella sp.]|nr:tetratricopeptide repeat protein [Fuerstiella sp.]MCP4506990.1 tetratricopeptide repeat protein [Fuerstiella sp.]